MTDRPSRLKLTVRDPVRDGRQSSRGSAGCREEPPGRSKYPPIWSDLSCIPIRGWPSRSGQSARPTSSYEGVNVEMIVWPPMAAKAAPISAAISEKPPEPHAGLPA